MPQRPTTLYHEAPVSGSTYPGAGMHNTLPTEGFGSFVRVPPLQLPFNTAYKIPPQFQQVVGVPRISVQTPAPPASGGMARPRGSAVSNAHTAPREMAQPIVSRSAAVLDRIRALRVNVPVGVRQSLSDLAPAGIQQRAIAWRHRGSVNNTTPTNNAGTR